MSNVQKDRIMEGAAELFFKAGIRSVTMDDIARHLGMSKKTVYMSFNDKDELVQALVSKRLTEDKDQICGVAANAANVMEEMVNMIKCAEDFFSKINPVVIHDMQKYHPESWQMLQKFKADVVVDNLQNIITRGIAEGYVRPEIDARIMARVHILQVETGFNATLFPPGEYHTWKVQMQIIEHFLYGICTTTGHEILSQHKNLITQD
jgi:AcrR family transcriptional regulator